MMEFIMQYLWFVTGFTGSIITLITAIYVSVLSRSLRNLAPDFWLAILIFTLLGPLGLLLSFMTVKEAVVMTIEYNEFLKEEKEEE